MKLFSTICLPCLTVAVLIAAAVWPGVSIAANATMTTAQNVGGEGFSAKRGRELFLSRPATGKPDTPSCTTCHSKDPRLVGTTRAGKEIAPMALSRTPDRYTDQKKIEKWFRRNCNSVLGRACTSREKGDFLSFMKNQ